MIKQLDSSDWREFMKKSSKKKRPPENIWRRARREFSETWGMLSHNERVTVIAARVCLANNDYNVANRLNRYIRGRHH